MCAVCRVCVLGATSQTRLDSLLLLLLLLLLSLSSSLRCPRGSRFMGLIAEILLDYPSPLVYVILSCIILRRRTPAGIIPLPSFYPREKRCRAMVHTTEHQRECTKKGRQRERGKLINEILWCPPLSINQYTQPQPLLTPPRGLWYPSSSSLPPFPPPPFCAPSFSLRELAGAGVGRSTPPLSIKQPPPPPPLMAINPLFAKCRQCVCVRGCVPGVSKSNQHTQRPSNPLSLSLTKSINFLWLASGWFLPSQPSSIFHCIWH